MKKLKDLYIDSEKTVSIPLPNSMKDKNLVHGAGDKTNFLRFLDNSFGGFESLRR